MEENRQMTIRQSDIELIATNLPEAFGKGSMSHDKCIAAGEQLIDAVQNGGMTDELDQRIYHYLEASKKTVKKTNELRSPATKLFDQFKKVFTSMENDVDPSKAGSVPYRLQQYRNQYAAIRREEEERRRQEEMRIRQVEQAKAQYRIDCEEEYIKFFNTLVNSVLNKLADVFSSISLDDFAEKDAWLRSFPASLAEDWDKGFFHAVRFPLNVDKETLGNIRRDVFIKLMDSRLRDEYELNVGNTRDEYLDMLPSKKKHLEKIAVAEAAEAERLKAAMKAKEEAEARRRELEQYEREEAERAAADVKKAAGDVQSLFDGAAAEVPAYIPKTTVRKKIRVNSPDGFLAILGFWWNGVGKTMTVEQLHKEFSKQVTYCNRAANEASPTFIEDRGIEYVDDVKAR